MLLACQLLFLNPFFEIHFCHRSDDQRNYNQTFVEFDRMREDDERRTLAWLTESIDRRLARERMEWARKLQSKSLTSGAIDADSAAGHSGKGKGGGKKGKGKRKR